MVVLIHIPANSVQGFLSVSLPTFVFCVLDDSYSK
jgi:hypothetical protein